MKKSSSTFFIVVLLVIIVAGAAMYLGRDKQPKADTQSNPTTQDETQKTDPDQAYKEKLAKFLTLKGAVMYGAYWCSHCKQQKEAFGDAFKYVNYVECDAGGENANPDECKAKGVTGYPTWVYNGQQFTGFQSLPTLASMVGFNDSDSVTDQSGSGETVQP